VKHLLEKLNAGASLSPDEWRELDVSLKDLLQCADHRDFALPDAAARCAFPLLPSSGKRLSSAQEKAVFLAFNYARFRLKASYRKLKREVRARRIGISTVSEVQSWLMAAMDMRAKIQELFLCLLPKAVKGNSYARHPLVFQELDDLHQHGALLLIRLVNDFEFSHTSGAPFEHYANSWLKREIAKKAREMIKRKTIEGGAAHFEGEEGEDAGEKPDPNTSAAQREPIWVSFVSQWLPNRHGRRYVRQKDDDGPDEAFGRALLRRGVALHTESLARSISQTKVDANVSESYIQNTAFENDLTILPSLWRKAWIGKMLRFQLLKAGTKG
jgi:hypothetical protein